MYTLWVHKDAESDLEHLWEQEEDAAALIEAFFEEIENDQDLLDRLTQRGYGIRGISPFNVDEVVLHKKFKRNIWRVKIWELEDLGLKYRILYAFDPSKYRYHILGIAPRNFAYQENHEFSHRIEVAYAELDIPNY